MISKSPERNTFQIKRLIEQVELGTAKAEDVEGTIQVYKSWQQQRLDLEETAEWKKDNMEYDLRSTQWIIDKVKADDVYAQHLYASICKNDITKNYVYPILTEKK